jgi:ATP-dependent protease ClpP protease subunit
MNNTDNKVQEEAISIVEQTFTKTIHHVYMNSPIESPDKYVKLLHLLNTISGENGIILYINSYGGYLHTAMQIISAIKNCRIPVNVVLSGSALSAASLILLSATGNIKVEYGSQMLCHWYSSSERGKGQENKASVDFKDDLFKNIFRDIYRFFLTDEELEKLFDGHDFWFGSEEVVRRLKRRKQEIGKIIKEVKDNDKKEKKVKK